MPLTLTATNAPEPAGPVDWARLKLDVVANLDVAAEFEALGVRFTRDSVDGKGRRECRGVGRPDDTASAFVNVETGVYFDSGSGEKAQFLFDFALKHGGFGRWIDVARHFAEKAGVAIGSVPSKSGGRILEQRYDYIDERGDVRYAVFRYVQPSGSKTFTQHRADGRGGWDWRSGNMDGVVPLPYRLPEILAADPSDPVFVCEGEKACDAVAGLGLLATTGHGASSNAGNVWPVLSWHLAGRDCYILPDNDAPGRTAAAKVAACLHGVVRSVKVVALPGLPPKGDAVEWIAAGGTAEELGRLVHAAPAWSPDAPDVPAPDGIEVGVDGLELPGDDQVVTVSLADVEAVPVVWLWPDRVPIGKLTLIAGEAKQGKSFLTMDFAARVSAGLEIPCGNGECMPTGSVVLLSAEDDLADTIKPRLLAHGADCSRIHALTTIRLADGKLAPFSLSYVPHLERAIVRAGDTKLVIIDPVPHYVGNGTDDHKNSQTRQLLEPLREMAARRKVAIVLITHLNKGTGTKALSRVTGSGAYTALARCNWLVVKDKDDPKRRLFLSSGNNLVEDPNGLAYRIDPVERCIVWEDQPVSMNADDALAALAESAKAEAKPRASKGDQARQFLVDLLAEGRELPHSEIVAQAQGVGISKNAVWEAKAAAGVVARKTGFTGNWVWSIPQAPPIAGSIAPAPAPAPPNPGELFPP